MPIVVSPKDAAFGAKGDGRFVVGCTMMAGQRALAPPAGSSFTTDDVGKSVAVLAAGRDGAPLLSTISDSPSGNAQLTDAAETSVTAAGVVYGTDDTVPIINWINYLATTPGARGRAPSGMYVLAGPLLTDATAGTTASFAYSAQVPLPSIHNEPEVVTSRVDIEGMPGGTDEGTVFASLYSSPSNPVPGSAVIGGPLNLGAQGPMLQMAVRLRDITVATMPNPQLRGIDLTSVAMADCAGLDFQGTGPIARHGHGALLASRVYMSILRSNPSLAMTLGFPIPFEPSNPNAVAYCMPGVGTPVPTRHSDIRVQGFYAAFQDGEQAWTDGLVSTGCRVGLVPISAAYPGKHNRTSMYWSQYALAHVDPGAGVANVPAPNAGQRRAVFMRDLELEDGPNEDGTVGFAPQADVHDPTNQLVGRVDGVWIGRAGVGTKPRPLLLQGAKNVDFSQSET